MSRRLSIIEQAVRSLAVSNPVYAPCTIDKSQLSEFIDICRSVCFPQFGIVTSLDVLINRMMVILTEQLVAGFVLRDLYSQGRDADSDPEPPLPNQVEVPSVDDQGRTKTRRQMVRDLSERIVEEFVLCRLPKVKVLLQFDVDALYDHDVASESKCEIVLCYPGIACMLHQRVAHELYLLGAPNNITRMLTEMAHAITGIDIHPHTVIGHHFFIDHGTGVVIGATSVIGNHVQIYQGVTLGAISFPKDPKTGRPVKHKPRHPIIEDGAIIYSNAVVLGRITVGRSAVIGGNAWVTRNVAAGSVVAAQSTRMLTKEGSASSPATSNQSLLFLASTDGSGI